MVEGAVLKTVAGKTVAGSSPAASAKFLNFMASKELRSREKEVSADFSKGHKLQCVQLWTPTWRDRLKILFGFKVILAANIFCEHKPGRTAASLIPQVTQYDAKALKANPGLEKIQPPAVHDETKVHGGVEVEKAR